MVFELLESNLWVRNDHTHKDALMVLWMGLEICGFVLNWIWNSNFGRYEMFRYMINLLFIGWTSLTPYTYSLGPWLIRINMICSLVCKKRSWSLVTFGNSLTYSSVQLLTAQNDHAKVWIWYDTQFVSPLKIYSSGIKTVQLSVAHEISQPVLCLL